MCWNAAVSLNTFLFSGFVLVIVMYNNAYTQYKTPELNNTWACVFMASFIFMQLVECFIWRNIGNKFYNNVFSILATLLLIIQPVCSLMMVSNMYLRKQLICAYLALAVPYSVHKFATTHISSVVGKTGHLRWNFIDMSPIIWAGWVGFFLFSFLHEKLWGGFLFGIITLVICALNYWDGNTIGSMWCWAVNSCMLYFAGYLLLYLPFVEKNSVC